MNKASFTKHLLLLLLFFLTGHLFAEQSQSTALLTIPLRSSGPYFTGGSGTTDNMGCTEAKYFVEVGKPAIIPLTVTVPPTITAAIYGVEGGISYSTVQGEGYLEMVSIFKKNGEEIRRIAKTLADSGPMGKILGDSNQRQFLILFNKSDIAISPIRIEVNLVLPEGGSVDLSNLKLVQYLDAASIKDIISPSPIPPSTPESIVTPITETTDERLNTNRAEAISQNQWWSPSQGAWIGGIGGSVLGLMGGLVGFMATRARQTAIRCAKVMTGLGVIMSIAGCIAIIQKQPYAVYYPLLLGSAISIFVFGINAFLLIKQTRREELRRIAALDTRA